MTKREKFEAIKGMISDVDLITFLDEQIAQLDKQKAANSKAKQETVLRAEKVFEALSEMSEPVTPSELTKMTSVEEVREYSPQRVTALFKSLGNRVKVEKVKGVNRWSIA